MLRNRQSEIHIRLYPYEKEQVLRNARRCSLSLSEYARKLLLGYEPRALSPIEVGRLMGVIYSVHGELNAIGKSELAADLRNAAIALQKVCASEDG